MSVARLSSHRLGEIVKAYDVLLLDNDGTCGRTETLHAEIGAKILQENGVPDMTVEERFGYTGFGEHNIWDHLAKQGRKPTIGADEFKQLQSDRFIAALKRVTHPSQIIRPGIDLLVQKFKEQRKPVIVVSNTGKDAVYAVQEACGLMPVMDRIITVDDLHELGKRKKPYPDPYLLAERIVYQEGLTDKRRKDCHFLAVEDSKTGVNSVFAAAAESNAHWSLLEITYATLGQKPDKRSTYVVDDKGHLLEAFEKKDPNQRKRPPKTVLSPCFA